MIITIFDAQGIQDYLFGSNRLAENIGASFLVNQALEEWPLTAAETTSPGRVNSDMTNPGVLNGGEYDIECIYTGGGNAAFFVSDLSMAKKFAYNYSLLLQEHLSRKSEQHSRLYDLAGLE